MISGAYTGVTFQKQPSIERHNTRLLNQHSLVDGVAEKRRVHVTQASRPLRTALDENIVFVCSRRRKCWRQK